MRRIFSKIKKKSSADAGREESRKRHRHPTAVFLTDDQESEACLSSYSEVPMILDWQLPHYNEPRDRLKHNPPPNPPAEATQPEVPVPTTTSFPLPTEVMYLIIENYISKDVKTLLNLGKAVPDLRHHCWIHAFGSVKVVIRQREIDRKNDKSNVDLFLQLISRTPQIIPYVRELDIQDRGRNVWHPQSLASSSQEDLTTLSLLLVKSQQMKLRSFRITSTLVWSNLPIHLKEAFFAMFSSTTLSEVALSGILLPVNLLALIRNLRVVDFQTGGVGPSMYHPSVASSTPQRVDALRIRDRNPFSNPMSVLGFTDHSFKPFSLPHLTYLEICLPGKHLSTVQEGLRICKNLERFKVFVGTAGGLPHLLTLGSLTSLKSLTLSADITNILDSSIRFNWVIDALESIHPESLLEDLTILIRTPSLELGKQCEWALLDALFQPEGENAMWSHLQLLKIVWCTARSQDIQENRNEDFVQLLPSFMPHLHERRIVKVQTTYSDTQYNFWTFT